MKKTVLFITPLVFSALVIASPSTAFAADPTYTVSAKTFLTEAEKPTLRGEAEDVTSIRLEIYKEGSTKRLFKSKETKVRSDAWSIKVTKKLSDGVYAVHVYGDKKKLGTETLVIGEDAKGGTLSVNSIPLLSGGGTRAGATVPVSYLQVRNTGSASTTLTAFNLVQNGSADPMSVSTLEVVDDRGATRWYTSGLPWKNKTAPAGLSYTMEPGELRLFTIKATLAPTAMSEAGKNLMLDVASVTSNGTLTSSLPIKGTVWSIGI